MTMSSDPVLDFNLNLQEDLQDQLGQKKVQPSDEQNNQQPGSSASNAELLSMINELQSTSEANAAKLFACFADKLAYDASKQLQIDRLHGELQQYRADLIARTNRPLVNGLIRMHDDIGKLVSALTKKSPDALTPELFLKAINGIGEDVEILLDQNGVATFTAEDAQFEPRRQRAVNKVTTADEQQAGTIASRVRPGFEQGNELIKKERVDVYVFEAIVEEIAEQVAEQTQTPQVELDSSEKPRLVVGSGATLDVEWAVQHSKLSRSDEDSSDE
ncbi:MAG: molecular chaperone GrpE [Phenylobacterium sp.]|jgi:molecular chaperone GrpE